MVFVHVSLHLLPIVCMCFEASECIHLFYDDVIYAFYCDFCGVCYVLAFVSSLGIVHLLYVFYEQTHI